MKTLLVCLALLAVASCVAGQNAASAKNVVIVEGTTPLPQAPSHYVKATIVDEAELAKYQPAPRRLKIKTTPVPAPVVPAPVKPADQPLDWKFNTTAQQPEDAGTHYELDMQALADSHARAQDQPLQDAVNLAVQASTGFVPPATKAELAAAEEHATPPTQHAIAIAEVVISKLNDAAAPETKSFTEVDSGVDMQTEAEAEAETEVQTTCGVRGSCIARASCKTASNTILIGKCPGTYICCQPKAAASTPARAPAPAPAASGSQVQRFIAAARSKIGRPYAYGAAGPNSFDCSGLVNWAAAQAGKTGLPRTADALSKFGRAVNSLSERQPGDLIFFGKPGQRVYHVGIYVGNNQMVDAPHTGAFVRQENYSYWPDRLTQARRIF